MDKQQELELKAFATRIRIEQIKEFQELGFGHVGGSLSATDLFAVLYSGVMKIDPKNPAWEERDRLVISKGHSGPAIYATLALCDYFPMDWLKTLNKNGTNLPSHCDRNKTPGIDMTTGSLGQGVSLAIGMALGLKNSGKQNRVYLLTGDGELDEGQAWEGVIFANQHRLSNLIAFVDYNKKQLDGTTDQVSELGDIAAKFAEFGWYAQSIDGNDVVAVWNAIEDAKANQKDKPAVIVLNTVKGAGVTEVENIELNHHIPVSSEAAERWLAELNAKLQEVT